MLVLGDWIVTDNEKTVPLRKRIRVEVIDLGYGERRWML